MLDLQRAGPGTRMAAKALDLLIQYAALIGLLLILAAAAGGNGGGVALLVIGLFGAVLILFGYPAIMEAAWRGRTVGKAAFGLRVLTREGAPIRFRHALIRSILYIVDGFLLGPAIGVLCLLLTSDTVRVGDLVAGTMVIRERTGAAPPAPWAFPPPYGYEQYVATLDVGGLNGQDYELVRGFLLRAGQLSPEARFALAIELSNPILRKLRLTAPSMHPEVFLQCVAAAMQRRYAAAQAYAAQPAQSGFQPTVPPWGTPQPWAPPQAPTPPTPTPSAPTPPAPTRQPSGDGGFTAPE